MVCALKILFGSILVLMIGVTTWASFDSNVIEGFVFVLSRPWGVATLSDAGFGFLTFYAWVFYKERGMIARIAWFIAVFALGNIAMSIYMLIQLSKLGPDAQAEDLLLRRPA